MSVEAVGGWVLKLAWSPFVAYWFYSKKKEDQLVENRHRQVTEDLSTLKNRVNNTYTKEESEKYTDLKLKHQSELVDAKIDQVMHQTTSIFELLKDNADKAEQRDLNMTEDISDIKTSVAVIANKVENLENKPSKGD